MEKKERAPEKASRESLLRLRAMGMSNPEIAEQVGVSRQRVHKLIGHQPAGVDKRYNDNALAPFSVAATVTITVSGGIRATDQATAQEQISAVLRDSAKAAHELGLSTTINVATAVIPA